MSSSRNKISINKTFFKKCSQKNFWIYGGLRWFWTNSLFHSSIFVLHFLLNYELSFLYFYMLFYCFSWMKCMSAPLSKFASLTELIFFNLGKFAISRYFEARNLINSKKNCNSLIFWRNWLKFWGNVYFAKLLGYTKLKPDWKTFYKNQFFKNRL